LPALSFGLVAAGAGDTALRELQDRHVEHPVVDERREFIPQLRGFDTIPDEIGPE